MVSTAHVFLYMVSTTHGVWYMVSTTHVFWYMVSPDGDVFCGGAGVHWDGREESERLLHAGLEEGHLLQVRVVRLTTAHHLVDLLHQAALHGLVVRQQVEQERQGVGRLGTASHTFTLLQKHTRVACKLTLRKIAV